MEEKRNIVRFQVLTGRVRRWPSSGLMRRVVCYKFTDVSDVLAASVIRGRLSRPDDGSSKRI
jgi:hypothetical protein